jgi:phosphoglycolate phosphatase-like HAD superfamily hydrolase
MKLFVWDFHGVLEKDNEHAVIDISNKVLRKLGYKERISWKDNLKLYGQKWFEYFQYILPNVSHEKHLEIQQACIAYEQAHPNIVGNNIKPNNHAIEVLEAIQKSRHDQILISNMSDVALEMFMDSIGITKYFSKKAFFCNTRSGNKVYTKHYRLREYLKKNDFDEIIIIGDTPNDISLKEVAGGTTYLYTHPHLEFKDCEPTYRINDLREVLKEV